MADAEQSTTLVEIIKSIGPYVVAVSGMAFGYFQSKKVAQIAKEKDLEIASIQQRSSFEMEKFKNSNAALLKLQEIYSPIFAKAESIIHDYRGLVAHKKMPTDLRSDIERSLFDDYLSFSVESRKKVLGEAIIICQMLQDYKAYEIVGSLDHKITEAMALVDCTGNSSGSEHVKEINNVLREFRLLYVSLFHRVANLTEADNKSSNADAASCSGS